MQGGKNKQPLGYTIVEVMIVLAVSGIIFLIAANFISGKQEKSSFTAGVNELASQIQDVANQVTTGRYSDRAVGCSYSSGYTNPNLVAGFARAQGTNSSCVFLGKLISTANTGGNYIYEVLSLAGGRLSTASVPATPNADAGDPTVINNLTQTQAIPDQLQILPNPNNTFTATDISGVSYSTAAVGFLESQGAASSLPGQFQSGANTVNLVYARGFTAGSPTSNIGASGGDLHYASSAKLCVTDGVQQAEIVVGTSNSQLNVNVIRVNPGGSCP